MYCTMACGLRCIYYWLEERKVHDCVCVRVCVSETGAARFLCECIQTFKVIYISAYVAYVAYGCIQ